MRIKLGPMVGIGVNEETYAQPQDPNNYISARYMPHKNLSGNLSFIIKKLSLNDKILEICTKLSFRSKMVLIWCRAKTYLLNI